MSDIFGRSGGLKLDFSGGGGAKRDKMEYLMIGGFALVILAALLVIVMQFVPAKRRTAGPMPAMHILCVNPECGKEKILEPGKDGQPNFFPPMMGGMPCEFCKQNTAYVAKECPNCHKYFVPKQWIWTDPATPPAASNEPIICPFCKTNVEQYEKEHPPK